MLLLSTTMGGLLFSMLASTTIASGDSCSVKLIFFSQEEKLIINKMTINLFIIAKIQLLPFVPPL